MSTILHSQIIEIYYNMQARLNFSSSDASILNIKRQFSCYINQMKSSTGYESIISQMEDLKSMLYFLKVSVINNKDVVIAEYSNIIVCFTDPSQWGNLLYYINSAETIFLECIGALLKILPSKTTEIFKKISNPNLSLCEKFTFFIMEFLYMECPNRPVFYGDLMTSIKTIFEAFNLSLNIFTIQLIKKFICENFVELNCEMVKVKNFFEEVFGRPSNFKFFHKASIVFNKFPRRSESHLSNELLSFTCTSFNKDFLPNENSPVGVKINISSAGMQCKNLRCDGFVTIGRSPLADFVLPFEDKKVNLLAFAMYFDGNIWQMIDCSKKVNILIKMMPEKPYLLKSGTIINVVGMIHIWIKSRELLFDCEKYYEDETKIQSSLHYEYIDGPLANSFGDKNKVCSTLTRIPKEFKKEYIFGKGGLGNTIDCFIDYKGYVSGKHFSFVYTNECNWKCIDLASKNGTYYLMKNYDQYIEKAPSRIMPLFHSSKETPGTDDKNEECKSEPEDKIITICISNYTFFIILEA